jgi:hypothetical protein
MLTELLMDLMGWTDAWVLGRSRISWHPWRRDSAHVGVWTGPHHDLLCVRHCETNEEAEAWLSPSGRTILGATLRSMWVYWNGPRLAHRHFGLDADVREIHADGTPAGSWREACWCWPGTFALRRKRTSEARRAAEEADWQAGHDAARARVMAEAEPPSDC